MSEISFHKFLDYDPEFNDACVKAGESDELLHLWVVRSTNKDGTPYYDRQKQHVPINVLRKAADKFMQGDRVLKDRHSGEKVGIVVHSKVFDKEDDAKQGIASAVKGWYVSVKPPAHILKMYRTGERNHLSIGGRGKFVATAEPTFKSDESRFFAKSDSAINTSTEKNYQWGTWEELNLEEISTVPVGAQDPLWGSIIKGVDEMTITQADLDKAVKEATEKATKEAADASAKAIEKAMEMTDAEKEFAKNLDEVEKAKFMDDSKKDRKKKMDDAKKALEEAATKSGEFVSKTEADELRKEIENLKKTNKEAEEAKAVKEFVTKEMANVVGSEVVKEAFAKTAMEMPEEARKEFLASLQKANNIIDLGTVKNGSTDGGDEADADTSTMKSINARAAKLVEKGFSSADAFSTAMSDPKAGLDS